MTTYLGHTDRKYIGTVVIMVGAKFLTLKADMPEAYLYFKEGTLRLRYSEGMCGSGWTSASWCNTLLVEESPAMENPLETPLEVGLDLLNLPGAFACHHFWYDSEGIDPYYPRGNFCVGNDFGEDFAERSDDHYWQYD